MQLSQILKRKTEILNRIWLVGDFLEFPVCVCVCIIYSKLLSEDSLDIQYFACFCSLRSLRLKEEAKYNKIYSSTLEKLI